jgi:Ser-tRNA(Ala) deacylase AlaX
MNKYCENPTETTEINFKLEYFNTTSSKMIFEVLKIAESLIKDGHKVNLNWYYEKEDPDLKDEGLLISSNLDVKLNFIEIDEFDFGHF